MTPQEQVMEFHRAFGIEIDAPWTPALIDLRISLLDEEVNNELIPALRAGDRAGSAQELADSVIVAYSTAISLGIDLDGVIAAVHAANMSKLNPDGSVRRRADGKVLKGPNYRPSDIAAALAGIR